VFESADARKGATAFAEKRHQCDRNDESELGAQVMTVKLQVGQQLMSAVDTTAVIVVRAPDREVTLTCGGAAMAAAGQAVPAEPDPALMGGTQLGKRYADAADTIQLLCTKAGEGTLALDGEPMAIQAAKPLPSSD
jgi:hypothetical protein